MIRVNRLFLYLISSILNRKKCFKMIKSPPVFIHIVNINFVSLFWVVFGLLLHIHSMTCHCPCSHLFTHICHIYIVNQSIICYMYCIYLLPYVLIYILVYSSLNFWLNHPHAHSCTWLLFLFNLYKVHNPEMNPSITYLFNIPLYFFFGLCCIRYII